LSNADNYYRWIASELSEVLHGKVLEVGAGSGTFTRLIAESADSVDALEPSLDAFNDLQTLAEVTSCVNPILGTLPELEVNSRSKYDNAVLVNVLEHIEDDETTLAALGRLVRPGGQIAVWVPAHEVLYSRFDFEIGHYRRYSRRELRAITLSVGLDIERLSFMNAFGAIAWGAVATVARGRPTRSRLATFWDQRIIPIVGRLEKEVSFPWGQSLLLVARVSESNR